VMGEGEKVICEGEWERETGEREIAERVTERETGQDVPTNYHKKS